MGKSNIITSLPSLDILIAVDVFQIYQFSRFEVCFILINSNSLNETKIVTPCLPLSSILIGCPIHAALCYI